MAFKLFFVPLYIATFLYFFGKIKVQISGRPWTQQRRTHNLVKFLEPSLQEYRLVAIRNTSGFKRVRCGLNYYEIKMHSSFLRSTDKKAQFSQELLNTSINVMNMIVFKRFKVFRIGEMGSWGCSRLTICRVFWPIFCKQHYHCKSTLFSKVNVTTFFLVIIDNVSCCQEICVSYCRFVPHLKGNFFLINK